MKVSFDVISRKVVGIFIPASPFIFSIDVPDNFTLSKTIQTEILPENSLPIEEIIEGEIAEEKKYSYKTVLFTESPNEFTLEEVLDKKAKDLLVATNKDSIILEEFVDESSIDLAYEEHKANTGVKICDIMPQGKIKIKPITLIHPATHFVVLEPLEIKVTINGEEVIGGEVIFSEEQTQLDIVIENVTDITSQVSSLVIVY